MDDPIVVGAQVAGIHSASNVVAPLAQSPGQESTLKQAGNSVRTDGISADLIVRAGRPEDAPTSGRICYEAFRSISDHHNFPPDFPSAEVATGLLSGLLAHPGFYSVVAELDGRIVGSNFLDERSAIVGVGPITVDPTVQDRQIGRRLMQAVLDRAAARRFAGVRLVQAAYHSRSLALYAKLGFQVREPLACMQGRAIQVEIPGGAVRQAREADLESCSRVCRLVHGHDRSGEVLDAIRAGTATVVEHGGRITGYATAMAFFGHAVGETADDLKALIGAAPSFDGPGILVPADSLLLAWCLANGLRVVQLMTLMSIGLYNKPAGSYLPSVLY
jgi:predicted N-acetyltransferase YhbS